MLAAPAQAFNDTSKTPPSLHSVHSAVTATHHWQALNYERPARYYYGPDHASWTLSDRWRAATAWWARAQAAHDRYAARAGFLANMRCISLHEEYGLDGPNTRAGKLGFVSSVGSYLWPAPAIAARYGNSWLGIHVHEQLAVAEALVARFGYSPWSTRGLCGL